MLRLHQYAANRGLPIGEVVQAAQDLRFDTAHHFSEIDASEEAELDDYFGWRLARKLDLARPRWWEWFLRWLC
jgi:hypothetical protein